MPAHTGVVFKSLNIRMPLEMYEKLVEDSERLNVSIPEVVRLSLTDHEYFDSMVYIAENDKLKTAVKKLRDRNRLYLMELTRQQTEFATVVADVLKGVDIDD